MAGADELAFCAVATPEAVYKHLQENRAAILANNAAFREWFGSFEEAYVTGCQVGPSDDGLYLGFRFDVVGRDPVKVAIPASMFGVFCNEIALAMNLNMERIQAAFCPPEGNA
jgi:hypothetical protein